MKRQRKKCQKCNGGFFREQGKKIHDNASGQELCGIGFQIPEDEKKTAYHEKKTHDFVPAFDICGYFYMQGMCHEEYGGDECNDLRPFVSFPRRKGENFAKQQEK
jgi:hypothetical protein